MNRRAWVFLLTAAMAGATSLLATNACAVFSVTEPWVRAAPDNRNAEFFVKLQSSDPVTLIGADSFAAKSTTLLAPGTREALKSMPLPANTTVELKPQAHRILLAGLVRKLKMGEYVPVTLFVRGSDGKEQKLFVNAEVRQRSPTEDERDHAHEPHKH